MYAQQKIQHQASSGITNIVKQDEENWFEEQKQGLEDRQLLTTTHYVDEQLKLKKHLDEKLISERNYNKELEKLKKEEKQKLITNEIEFIDDVSDTDRLSKKQTYELKKRKRELQENQVSNASVKNKQRIQGALPLLESAFELSKPVEGETEQEKYERRLKMFRDFSEQTIEIAQSMQSSLKQIKDNAFAQEQLQLDIEKQKLETSSQQKIAAINATTGYQITKENQVAIVVAQTTAKQNELQQKQNQLALKKAKSDKESAEFGVLLNTALAISKVLPLFADPLTVPLAISEVAIITAMGAAQYAAAASTPLPQFYMGGETKTPFFSAGERGIELIQPIDKPAYFTTSTASVYNEKIGAKVTPHEKTMEIIQYAVSNVVSQEIPKSQKNDGFLFDKIIKEVANIIADKIEDSNCELVYAISRSKQPNIIVQNKNKGDNLTWKIGK